MFLVANLSIALLPATGDWGLRWPWFSGWVDHLNSEIDTSLGNAWSVTLWILVVALAIAHLRQKPQARRWIWIAGWSSFAILAAVIALLETHDSFRNQFDGAVPIEGIARHLHWMILAAPLALPLMVLAGSVLWAIVGRNPTLRILAGVAVVLGFLAVVRDSVFYLYDPARNDWPLFLEDGSEIMAAAILVVVLAGSVSGLTPFSGSHRWGRVLAIGCSLTVVIGVLALIPRYQYEWGTGPPDNYTGPISLIEQDIRVHHPFLSRIDVWSFVEAGSADQADIFMRLTPLGDTKPVREGSTSVRYSDWSEQPVTFTFSPIAESRGQSYRLAIGVLGPQGAFVFLGLTGNDPFPISSVIINGEPTQWANDLSMQAHWEGRGARVLIDAIRHEPSHLVLLVDLVLTVSLWMLATVLRPWRLGPSRP